MAEIRRENEQRTVLVVDDDEESASSIASALRLAGRRALIANEGAHALTILASHVVDVVLLDLMMPGMNGWELLAVRRADRHLRRIPIIVTSALRERMEPGELLPGDLVLPRPFSYEALDRALHRCLEHAGQSE